MTLYDESCTAVSSVPFCFETFLRVLGIHLKSQVIHCAKDVAASSMLEYLNCSSQRSSKDPVLLQQET
jgi:hypothetical protein